MKAIKTGNQFLRDLKRALAEPDTYLPLIVRQMRAIGVDSVPLVVMVAAFIGGVIAIQVRYQLFPGIQLSIVGLSSRQITVLETGPLLTGLVLAGRVGAKMTAEIGTMRVTEQIDALESMAVDPVHYLVAPRILACTLMMPVLAVGFAAIGLAGAYLIALTLLGLDHVAFLSRIETWVMPSDLLETIVKGTAFGLLIGSIACFKGFHATGGSRGVGLATTRTVVATSIAILLMDYVITSVWLEAFPPTGLL